MLRRTATTLGIGVTLLVTAATLSTPRLAFASPEDDAKATAKRKLVEGGELLKQGEYASALARFQEAYELVHSPKIEYNFGLAYMGLGRTADAVESFEKFLTEATDASPDLRANAERHRSTLGQQVGSLVVECDANGAEVSVDGRSRGVTPLAAPIRLDPGPHQLVVEKADTPPYAEKFTMTAGKRLTLQAHLAGPPPPPVAEKPEIVPPPPPTTGPPPVPELTPEEKHERTRALERKLAWGTGVVAVAALGVGIVGRVIANGRFHDFNTRMATYGMCDADDRVREHGGSDCSSLLSAGRSWATISTAGLIGAGAVGATSAILFYVSRKGTIESATTGSPTATTGTTVARLACAPDLARPGVLCDVRF